MVKKIILMLIVAVLFSSIANTIAGLLTVKKDIRVIDGDTVQLKEERVRLACIDAPEMSQPYGNVAENALRKFVAQSNIVTVEVLNKDRFGRSIGILNVDGKTAQEYLVGQGLAYVYHQYKDNCPPSLYNKLTKVEKRAIKNNIGVWKDQDNVAPWIYRRN